MKKLLFVAILAVAGVAAAVAQPRAIGLNLGYGPCFYHQSHPQLGIVFALASSLHSFWSYFSTLLQYCIGHLPTWGVYLSVSYLFAFSYCSWSSQGKNTEVVWHSLLQRTMFCQNSPP